MNAVSSFLRPIVFASAVLLAFNPTRSRAQTHSERVHVKAVSGNVTFSTGSGNWQRLQAGQYLERGATVKTGADSTADLILDYNGTVLRLLADSTLEFARLDREQAGAEAITETGLKLLTGTIVGSQRKLAAPSRLKIQTPQGDATILGTEYVVRADGAVSVLSGAVSVTYNLPGNKGSVKVTIQAGFSFDPATGQVVPTSPDYLVNLIADVNTVRLNAQTFKVAGGATVVVKPEEVISPSSPSPATQNTRNTQTP